MVRARCPGVALGVRSVDPALPRCARVRPARRLATDADAGSGADADGSSMRFGSGLSNNETLSVAVAEAVAEVKATLGHDRVPSWVQLAVSADYPDPTPRRSLRRRVLRPRGAPSRLPHPPARRLRRRGHGLHRGQGPDDGRTVRLHRRRGDGARRGGHPVHRRRRLAPEAGDAGAVGATHGVRGGSSSSPRPRHPPLCPRPPATPASPSRVRRSPGAVPPRLHRDRRSRQAGARPRAGLRRVGGAVRPGGALFANGAACDESIAASGVFVRGRPSESPRTRCTRVVRWAAP